MPIQRESLEFRTFLVAMLLKISLHHSYALLLIAYIANKLGFSYLAAILDAILDFSARHHLCQFMPALSYTTDYTEPGDQLPPRNRGLFCLLSPYHIRGTYKSFPIKLKFYLIKQLVSLNKYDEKKRFLMIARHESNRRQRYS